MAALRRALPLVVLAMLSGCSAAQAPVTAGFTEFYADSSVVGEVSAPAVAVAATGGASGVRTLALQLRLHNRSRRALELSESTRCTVLRWSVINAQGITLETPPNKPCAQQVASRMLPPAQALARAFDVQLTARRYRPGARYTLRFSFWGYRGRHAFEVR